MSTELDPIVGNWYRDLDKGPVFTVISIDEREGTVQIQYFDGDLEELDANAWLELTLEPAEAPEDWSGPVDNVEEDDLDDGDTDAAAKIRRTIPEEDWQDPRPEDERDEWSEGGAAEELYGTEPDA